MSANCVFISYEDNGISLPLNNNGNLNLSVVKQYFPEAQGLTYTCEDGKKFGLSIESDEIIINKNVKCYDVYCNSDYRREPRNKRKHQMISAILETIQKNRKTDNKSDNQNEKKVKVVKQKRLKIIVIGWLHRSNELESYGQVKKPVGGKKEIKLDDSEVYTAEDIKQRATQEFATQAPLISEYDISLGTYDGTIIHSFITKENNDDNFWSYLKSQHIQLSRLNLYLFTTKKEKQSLNLDESNVDEDTVSILYEYAVQSKYADDLSIGYLPKGCLYDNLLEHFGHMSREEFNPYNEGYHISSISVNGKDFLSIWTSANMSRTFVFPLSEVIQGEDHFIIHGPDELNGKCEGISGVGAISNCDDDCKPIFSWYKDGELITQGQYMYWLSNTVDGCEYTCTFTCKKTVKMMAVKMPDDDMVNMLEPDVAKQKIKKQNILEVPSVSRNQFTISSKLLGAGAQGTVREGLWLGTEVAIKIIPTSGTINKTVGREISVLQSIRHPNIILLMGICTESDRIFMIMELFDGKSLENYLFNEYDDDFGISLDLKMKNKIGKQLCQALNYLHQQEIPIVHGDIKPSNILIDSQMKLKLCDLGLSKFSLMTKTLRSTVNGNKCAKGTMMYMAPELLLRNMEATVKSDIWSVACTLIELYSESQVWDVKDEETLKTLMEQEKVPSLSSVPEQLVDVLTRSFDYQPQRRPQISDILAIY